MGLWSRYEPSSELVITLVNHITCRLDSEDETAWLIYKRGFQLDHGRHLTSAHQLLLSSSERATSAKQDGCP